MKTDKFGQIVYTESEIIDALMHEVSPDVEGFKPGPFLTNLEQQTIEQSNAFVGYQALIKHIELDKSIEEFDRENQQKWWMPDMYKEMDIAEYILHQCETESELQRCGEELLLYVEKGLLDLLRYVKYLVDVMELNNIIWGVGRGSSVSSYVLYKLKVHRIDSMFYQLDPKEFLR